MTAVEIHCSAIYRELKRNSSQEAYEPGEAHQQAVRRRTGAAKYRMPKQVVRHVELALSCLWSPEQISGVGKLIGLSVSHEWIYRHVAADTVYPAPTIFPASPPLPSSGSRPDLALAGIGKQLVPFFNGINHGIYARGFCALRQYHVRSVELFMVSAVLLE